MASDLAQFAAHISDLFDEDAAENGLLEETLADMPVHRYIAANEEEPLRFIEVTTARNGLISSEPETSDLLLSPLYFEELRCPICKEVLSEPHFTVPCGHVFCHACIQESLRENLDVSTWSCPVCRTLLDRNCPLVRARTIAGLLSQLKICCENGVAFSDKDQKYQRMADPSACPEILSLTEGPAHFKVCPYKLLKCPFHAEGCTHVSLRRDLTVHRTACEFRTVRCECGQQVRVTAREEHAKVCPAALVECPHRRTGCTWPLFRRDALAHHLSTCPYELLKGLLAHKDAQIEGLTRDLETLTLREKRKRGLAFGDNTPFCPASGSIGARAWEHLQSWD